MNHFKNWTMQDVERVNGSNSGVQKPAPEGPITFFVQGDPKPQPRPRAFVLRGRGGKPILSRTGEPIIRVHEAGTAEYWKNQVAVAAAPHTPFKPLEGPISVRLEFVFRRPKAHYRANGQLKPTAPMRHISRGDVDNLFKSVTDALTVLGMWMDDGQVCQAEISKWYGDRPGCTVTVTPLYGELLNLQREAIEAKQEALGL